MVFYNHAFVWSKWGTEVESHGSKHVSTALPCRSSRAGGRRRGIGRAASRRTWAQFRGPDGQGVSVEKGLPDDWSATRNVLWKTPIPGRGHSSPVVWGDRIFLTTAIEGELVPGAKGVQHIIEGHPYVHPQGVGDDRRHTFKVLAIDARDGQRRLGADRARGAALRHAAQEGQLRVADADHRRQAGLDLLRVRRPPLRLRHGRQPEVEGVAGRDRDRRRRRGHVARPLQGPADRAVRRGRRRQVVRGRPRQAHGQARSGARRARCR